ncbi:acetate/propionate family kinase [Prauserella flavalba]|uniref:Acetate kinase n=1 Tax=Prauserella flavalba TaxID=1477506 RepID=A0A318LR49_9PSEU|nr:acetate kinase [Prauserella flavalba]PXY36983.1 acetate kinase [Prauserella flavalba]
MRVLTVNPGSSSLKLAVVEGGTGLAELTLDHWSGASGGELARFAGAHAQLDAAAVRVVHGGARRGPVRLDETVLGELERWVPMAPLHQPRSVALARHLLGVLPGVPVVACFDTAFHADLPERAATYALPHGWRATYGIRRYGFHGLSLAHACRQAARVLGAPPAELGLVCCHLGAGASVTAVDGGRSVDTSMGFTPLEGVPMATRAGSIDPGIPLYLMRQHGFSVSQVDTELNHHSGLAGLSGTSGDIREVVAARAHGDPAARLALDVYVHRLRREIAAAAVSLPALHAVVLTGGVAEHQAGLRAELFTGAHFGIRVDPVRNAADGDRVISTGGSGVAVVLIACREDLELARQTELLLLANQVEVSAR